LLSFEIFSFRRRATTDKKMRKEKKFRVKALLAHPLLSSIVMAATTFFIFLQLCWCKKLVSVSEIFRLLPLASAIIRATRAEDFLESPLASRKWSREGWTREGWTREGWTREGWTSLKWNQRGLDHRGLDHFLDGSSSCSAI